MISRLLRLQALFLIGLLISLSAAQGQTCPPNIGFESGNLDHWEFYKGTIERGGFSLQLEKGPPSSDVHGLIENTFPQILDFFGGFPINSPNGSKYSFMLGNSATGAGAERATYTFTIPADKNDYSIIYNYAVVFQNPNHTDAEQPRFTTRVYDVSTGQYLSCGSFEFVASSGIDGFSQSKVAPNVWYKPWSPVTVKLYGLAGKTIRLEFTNNDCAQGGHFGYAYLDVIENCNSPISGNVYCNGADEIKLLAPFGFKSYKWYNKNFTELLGQSHVLALNPPPAPGTEYAVIVEPFPGLGCLDTLRTTIKLSPDAFHFTFPETIEACAGTFVNLTDSVWFSGSTPGLNYSYFRDPDGTDYMPTPKNINFPGLFYVKAENSAGCNDILPVRVLFKPSPFLQVNQPPEVCFPATVDLTLPALTAGSDPDVSFSYWMDEACTKPLADPSKVSLSGTYFIKASSLSLGCSTVKPVEVSVLRNLNFLTLDQRRCNSVDLTAPGVTSGIFNFSYTYWQDAAATIPLPDPASVKVSGTYYIKGTTPSDCSVIRPVKVTVDPEPLFMVSHPAPVVFPETVDLTKSFSAASGITYTYWKDAAASQRILTPEKVGESGTYYIRASSDAGCLSTQAIEVVIHPPPPFSISAPNAFSPNNDGINDYLKLIVSGVARDLRFTIFNRLGQMVYESSDLSLSWDGKHKGVELPSGTYFWVVSATDVHSGNPYSNSGSVAIIR